MNIARITNTNVLFAVNTDTDTSCGSRNRDSHIQIIRRDGTLFLLDALYHTWLTVLPFSLFSHTVVESGASNDDAVVSYIVVARNLTQHSGRSIAAVVLTGLLLSNPLSKHRMRR